MSQPLRVIVAVTYLILLLLFSWLVFGQAIPRPGPSGTWFYAGAAIVVLSAALTEPHYASPAIAVANAVAALFAVLAFSAGGEDTPTSFTTTGAYAVLLFAVAVAIVGLAAIVTKDLTGRGSRISETSARMARTIGSARVVFSVVFLAAAYGSYSGDGSRLFALFLVWVVIVVIRPLEWLAARNWSLPRSAPQVLGRVVGLRHPGLVEATIDGGDLALGSPVLLGARRDQGTVLDAMPDKRGSRLLISTGDSIASVGDAVYATAASDATVFLGPVEPGSDLIEIRLRVPASTDGIREGNLVRVDIRGCPVLYQIIAAVLKQEAVTSEVTHRYVEIRARKIGAWDDEGQRFQSVPWLPAPGAPVAREATEESVFQSNAIGVVPGTTCGIRVEPDLLVTHNTAILGILGIGKTFLAFELIRRIMAAGCKVVVLDITSQYSRHFGDLHPQWYETRARDGIANAISGSRDAVHQNMQDGGNVKEFAQAVKADLEDFVNSDYLLKIYNPESFDATRQDSKLFSGQAGIASLTPAEVTRIFAEALLQVVSDEFSEKARVCVILEEAHSLVPEWNSTSYDGDQRASAATAKAVLQGRKYGMGVMVITQRTANVTKTILNQCNTVFAMRTYDATGMEFLRNYVGSSYADVLSGLEGRSAVVFGRASSCPSPVIVQLNDHETMVREFWEHVATAVPRPEQQQSVSTTELNDEPF